MSKKMVFARTLFSCVFVLDPRALLLVVHHPEPLREEPALALPLRAILDLAPVGHWVQGKDRAQRQRERRLHNASAPFVLPVHAPVR